jgi:hypothetical protein
MSEPRKTVNRLVFYVVACPDGDRFEGNFKKGKCLNGPVKVSSPAGGSYENEYKKGLP